MILPFNIDLVDEAIELGGKVTTKENKEVVNLENHIGFLVGWIRDIRDGEKLRIYHQWNSEGKTYSKDRNFDLIIDMPD